MPKYICDNCEDYETIPASDFREGMHCECGGHLFLELKDHYKKQKNECFSCVNYASILCMTCWKREK